MGRKSSQKIATILSIFFTLLTISFVANAAVLRVPSNYPTIQTAIDAAIDGDTVLVSDGTYTGEGNKNLDFKGKAITVKSQNGPDHCIIDCENEGRGFCLHSAEERDSVISGFTIKNGHANENSYNGRGGGILVLCDEILSFSCPTISNCIIIQNRADQHGGGIYYAGNSDFSGTISDCIITDNMANDKGGGIYSTNSTKITNCTISENTEGGIYFVPCGLGVSIENCTISKNIGSGIDYINSECRYDVTINGCVISKNTGNGIKTSCDGWGNFSANITNCIINENAGSGVYSYSGDQCSPPTITNCTINKNNGSGVSYRQGPIYGSPPTITNCILWGDSPDEIHDDSLEDFVREARVGFSDIQGGYPGTGNIDADPLFVGNGDYHLTAGSPCIDAGTSDGAPTDDIEGTPRPQGVGYDMGAYEYPGPISPIAEFSANPTSGNAPLEVTFTDESTGQITSWEWDFGDGGTSADQNPTHTYYDPGSYTVSLTVMGPNGSDTKTKVAYITVSLAEPIPDIKANGSDGPLAVLSNTPVTVTVSLNPGYYAGQNADWWVYAVTPFGWYSYVYPSGWRFGLIRAIANPLFSLSSTEILERTLPAGYYVITFAVDNNTDGILDGTWSDFVEVTVE